jgi:hypothetical protein
VRGWRGRSRGCCLVYGVVSFEFLALEEFSGGEGTVLREFVHVADAYI